MRERIQFLFKFPSRIRLVDLAVIYDPEMRAIPLLIRKASEPETASGL